VHHRVLGQTHRTGFQAQQGIQTLLRLSIGVLSQG
jgi:hypothetical protein